MGLTQSVAPAIAILSSFRFCTPSDCSFFVCAKSLFAYNSKMLSPVAFGIYLNLYLNLCYGRTSNVWATYCASISWGYAFLGGGTNPLHSLEFAPGCTWAKSGHEVNRTPTQMLCSNCCPLPIARYPLSISVHNA